MRWLSRFKVLGFLKELSSPVVELARGTDSARRDFCPIMREAARSLLGLTSDYASLCQDFGGVVRKFIEIV